MAIQSDIDTMVLSAYRKLKQSSYYDSVDLFLRARIASFETDPEFEALLETISSAVSDLISGGTSEVDHWIERIDFFTLPKKIKDPNDSVITDGFISNVRSADTYTIDGVNYFISAPIPLHILDVLWCMTAGPILESDLLQGCLGNRLENTPSSTKKNSSSRLFRIFHRQYAKWRDQAIEVGTSLLDQNTDVLMIALDVKQCFYNLSARFDQIVNRLERHDNDQEQKRIAIALTYLVDRIHRRFNDVTAKYLSESHSPKTAKIIGLPVGLDSSKIIANWELTRFDRDVQRKLRPTYYGRYVDDILIVLSSPSQEALNGKLESVLSHYFEETDILKRSDGSEDDLELCSIPQLMLQKEKIIIQYFDHRHSRAGLTEFSRELSEQASEFRFLPGRSEDEDLDQRAYDVLYKGSINTLRSVIGLSENSTELSKYLSRRILQHKLCSTGVSKSVINQLFRFYQGRNIFDFCRLWEKVISLLQTSWQYADLAKFYNSIVRTIQSLVHRSDMLANKVRKDSEYYLSLSVAIPSGLLAGDFMSSPSSRNYAKVLSNESYGKSIWSLGRQFRCANLVRHNFVAFSLLNYTQFSGDLSDTNTDVLKLVDSWDISHAKKYSPRHIHLDEYQLFYYTKAISAGSVSAQSVWNQAKDEYDFTDLSEDLPTLYEVDGRTEDTGVTGIHVSTDISGKTVDEGVLCIGVANLRITPSDIEKSYHPTRHPNTSTQRRSVLDNLINCADISPKCDLLVLPEVSVPHAWLPFMVSEARRRQIGMVFGLEHRIAGKEAFNLAATILPFRETDRYKACFVSLRTKNHYSPHEEIDLRRLGYSIPKPEPAVYELYSWRDLNFTVYNCFELTDVHHRGLFRSELDLLVAVAWNQDTNYYSNIIESASRDLHCYVVQANTSQYGDSRVTAPLPTVEKDFIRVKGGENAVLLKAKLNIADLRDFQCKEFSPSDKRFKPKPAGYNSEQARRRNDSHKFDN